MLIIEPTSPFRKHEKYNVVTNPKGDPMKHSHHLSVCLFALAVVGLVFPSLARATYPISGGSYTANVAVRYGEGGVLLDSVAGVRSANVGVQSGVPNNVIDYGGAAWALVGFSASTDTATITETLDQVYQLNKIKTIYGTSMDPTQYQLRVSTDGIGWTTVVPQKPTAGVAVITDTFTTTSAKYIEWTLYGPGSLFGAPGSGVYSYPNELQAFVASTAPSPGTGYNVIQMGTIIQTIGGSLALALDNNPVDTSYIVPGAGGMTNVVDLGAMTRLDHVNFGFYSGQSWNHASVDVSTDNVNWTTLVDSNNITTSSFTFAPTAARYIRLGGWGNGALIEFSAFDAVPEPSTVLLFGIGAGLLRSRWSRRSKHS